MAVVREDVVKVTYDVDSKPLDKVDDSIDELVKSTQKMAGDSGVGKLTKGFQSLADSAKNFANTKITNIKNSLNEMKNKLTEGEKGAKGLFNAVKNLTKTGFSKLLNGVKSLATGLGKALTAAGKLAVKLGGLALKGLATGVGAAAAGLTALGTQAIKAYGDFEQLKGGVETLFGAGGLSISEYAKANGKNISDIAGEWYALERAQNTVLTNANNAYKEAGMSANQYMETVTSFSASLIQSMGGDTEAAAAKAHTAIVDMSDNANKMGTDIELLRNAYSGFAKQNYTMLDNLKLGYGGTKEEMQRLLNDASKLPNALGKKFDISNYADVVEAIHLVQENMGIAGTTANEAEKTLQGSLSAMKGAWQNFMAGLANEDADLDQLVGNLVDSVVTFGKNLIPRIKIMLPRLVEGLTQLAQAAADEFPSVLADVLPTLVDGAVKLVDSLVTTLQDNSNMLSTVAIDIVMKLAQFILQSLPKIILVGLELIVALANGIAQQLPSLIPMAVQAIVTIANGLLNSMDKLVVAALQIIQGLCEGLIANLPMIATAAIQLLQGLAQSLLSNLGLIISTAFVLIDSLTNGLLQNLPMVIQAAMQLFMGIIEGLLSNIDLLIDGAVVLVLSLVQGFAQNLPTIVQAGVDLIVAVSVGLIKAVPVLLSKIPEIFGALYQGIMEIDWLKLGGDILSSIGGGLWNGVKSLFSDAEGAGKSASSGVSSGITANSYMVSNASSGLATSVTTGLSGIQTDTYNIGVQTSAGYAEGINSSASVAISATSDLTTQISDLTNTDMTALVDTTGTTLTGLPESFTTNYGDALDVTKTSMNDTAKATQQGMDKIVSTVKKTDLYDAGRDIMLGLNRGMLNMLPTLITTATRAANAIKQATNAALDIHSPSKVMEKTGEFAGLGQIEGLRNTIPEMQVAAREVSTASIPYDTYSPESSSTYYNSNESSYTTVSPVFNLTISGSQDDRAMARRVKRYVAEAISETFESLERKSGNLREV